MNEDSLMDTIWPVFGCFKSLQVKKSVAKCNWLRGHTRELSCASWGGASRKQLQSLCQQKLPLFAYMQNGTIVDTSTRRITKSYLYIIFQHDPV